MTLPVRYTFSLISPFSYLGAATFFDLAKRADAQTTCRLVSIGDLFTATGGVPLPKRHPARQAYRLVELQRWAKLRGKEKMNLKPAHFPADDSIAAAVVNAVIAESGDPEALILAFHRLVWEEDGNIADETTVHHVTARAGYDAVRLLTAAKSPEIAGLRAVHTQEAIDAGIFGLPWYQVGSQEFWGQNTLDLVAKELGLASA